MLYGTKRALWGKREPIFHLTATTTGAAETVTIDRMTPAAGKALTIKWGDGTSTTVSAGDTTAKSHEYASAASYGIQITNALDIVQIDVHDAKLSGVNSSELANSAITHFLCYSIGNTTANVIDSTHMSGWAPTYWRLYSMPAGTYAIDSADMASWTPSSWWLLSMPTGTYAIDSADMASWTPSYWILYSMPAGTYAIDSTHMASWTPTYWWLYDMPAADTTWTLAADDFAGFVSCTSFLANDNALNETQIDALLWGMYQATLSRTVTGGTINVGGTNAAPSGTFQAASACPVSAATDGKEVAWELLNDTCDAIANHWAAVTITA